MRGAPSPPSRCATPPATIFGDGGTRGERYRRGGAPAVRVRHPRPAALGGLAPAGALGLRVPPAGPALPLVRPGLLREAEPAALTLTSVAGDCPSSSGADPWLEVPSVGVIRIDLKAGRVVGAGGLTLEVYPWDTAAGGGGGGLPCNDNVPTSCTVTMNQGGLFLASPVSPLNTSLPEVDTGVEVEADVLHSSVMPLQASRLALPCLPCFSPTLPLSLSLSSRSGSRCGESGHQLFPIQSTLP